MTATEVVVDRPAEHVLRLTLDGPRTRGSLSPETFDALTEAVRAAETDRDTRVVVLTGSPGTFSSGLDLSFAPELARMEVEEMLAFTERAAAAIIALRHLSRPVIAAVAGPVVGVGLSVALAADIRLAVPKATFTAAFVRAGLSGGDCGTSWLLPRLVGLARAADILLTGRTVPAEEAERMGLVNRIVAAEELETETLELAASIARYSPLAVALTKRVLQTNVDAPSLEAAIELENRNQVVASRSPEFLAALESLRPAHAS